MFSVWPKLKSHTTGDIVEQYTAEIGAQTEFELSGDQSEIFESIAEIDVNTVRLDPPTTGGESDPGSSVDEPPRPSGQPWHEVYDRALIAEPYDEAWATSLIPTIESTIASTGIPYGEMETVCRTTMCRVILKHEFGLPESGSELPWDMGEYSRSILPIVQSDSRLRTTVSNTFPDQGFTPESRENDTKLVTTIYMFAVPPPSEK